MGTLALIAGGGLAVFIAGGFIVGFLMRNKDLAGVFLALAMVCAVVVVWNSIQDAQKPISLPAVASGTPR